MEHESRYVNSNITDLDIRATDSRQGDDREEPEVIEERHGSSEDICQLSTVSCQLAIKKECPSVPVCVTLDICDKQAEKANQAMQCNANVDIKLVDNKSIIISPTFYVFLVVGSADDD